MGQIDDERGLKGKSNGLYATPSTALQKSRNIDRRDAALSILDSGVGSVTSRDQIINPMELLSPSMYKNTRAGRAQYESDLEMLKNFQSQQEAAYQEWYDSPEQAALRERAAGLNPDLIGLENAGESAEAGASEEVPGQNLPTNGQIAFNAVQSISSILQTAGSLAGLATTFKQLPLMEAQTIGQQLNNDLIKSQINSNIQSNLNTFNDSVSKAISERFATWQSLAGVGADVAGWFADDSNFDDLTSIYAPDDNPRYAASLSSLRKGYQANIAAATKLNKELTVDNIGLATNLAQPYYSDDVKLMTNQLSPVMDAIFQLEDSTRVFQKKVIEAKSQYVDNIDPEKAATSFNQVQEYNAMLAKHKSIIEGAKSLIYDNLRSEYQFNPKSVYGFATGLNIIGQMPSQWEQFLLQYGASLISRTQQFAPDPAVEQGVQTAEDYIKSMQESGFLLVD